jgi:hypothetical protein
MQLILLPLELIDIHVNLCLDAGSSFLKQQPLFVVAFGMKILRKVAVREFHFMLSVKLLQPFRLFKTHLLLRCTYHQMEVKRGIKVIYLIILLQLE